MTTPENSIKGGGADTSAIKFGEYSDLKIEVSGNSGITPERSVSEIVEKIISNCVDCVYGMNINCSMEEAQRLYSELTNSPLLKKQLTQTLTAERQKREEAVKQAYNEGAKTCTFTKQREDEISEEERQKRDKVVKEERDNGYSTGYSEALIAVEQWHINDKSITGKIRNMIKALTHPNNPN